MNWDSSTRHTQVLLLLVQNMGGGDRKENDAEDRGVDSMSIMGF